MTTKQEAALTEKQEPVALHELLNQVIYGDFSTDIPENLTLALNAKKELHCLTHPAPSANAQKLADLHDVKRKLEWFVDNYPQDVATSRYDFFASINAAIAQAEKEVRRD